MAALAALYAARLRKPTTPVIDDIWTIAPPSEKREERAFERGVHDEGPRGFVVVGDGLAARRAGAPGRVLNIEDGDGGALAREEARGRSERHKWVERAAAGE
jgi:hypothetical protein